MRWGWVGWNEDEGREWILKGWVFMLIDSGVIVAGERKARLGWVGYGQVRTVGWVGSVERDGGCSWARGRGGEGNSNSRGREGMAVEATAKWDAITLLGGEAGTKLKHIHVEGRRRGIVARCG
eukprot:766638-Hanusia_phi.AAC.10